MLQHSARVRVLVLALAFCACYGAAEAQTATLTITNNGVVSGAVGVQGLNANVCNPSNGVGGTGTTCVFTYPINTPLRIAANSPQHDAGFLHDGSGDAAACALSTCNIILTVDSAITATFDDSQGPVVSIQTTLLGDGKGKVFFDNGTCQNFELGYTFCTTHYAVGSEVKFQGDSTPGSIFETFSGGLGDTAICGAASPCVFTASVDSSVNATFSALASVAINPIAPTINVGNNQQFSALGTFTNGMTRYGFDGSTNWLSHTSMDVARFSLATAVVNDRLYAIGGVDGFCVPDSPCEFGPLGTVEIFNPLITAYAEFEHAWMPRSSMTTPRGSLAAVTVGGKIYAIGGHTIGGDTVASMEVFNPATDSWSAAAPMSGPRAEIAAAVIDNTIYVVGGDPSSGSDPSIPLTTVEAYDVATNTWSTKSPMLTARHFPAAAAVNGTLYVIGGDGTGSVEAYNPGTDTWTTKAAMPGGVGSHRAAALNGLVYAVGGSPVTVKIYNPVLDSWATQLSTSQQPGGQFALAVLDGRLFAAGGNLADNTAVATFLANRPPEATWWSNNSAVGQVNNFNSGTVNGVSIGTATISARLVTLDSGAQSATLTVSSGGGGGGGGSNIFMGLPNEAFTQVGNAAWGCGTFSQNSTGPWEVTINYGEGGGDEVTPYVAPTGTCGGGPGTKGQFAFNHAYNSTGDFNVTVKVNNTSTLQSASQSFTIHVSAASGGGVGSTIFLGIPTDPSGGGAATSTNVGNANWGCGTFGQNAVGPWEVKINYGEVGGAAEVTPYFAPPAPCGGGTGTKGWFSFSHAYVLPGLYAVTVTVKNTATNAETTRTFHIEVQEGGGGGGGEDGCAQLLSNITVIGSVPFSTVHIAIYDRFTNELLHQDDAPFEFPEDFAVPSGQYRIELSVPAGYSITPSSFLVDAVCGEPVHLDATIGAVLPDPPSISVSLSPNMIWPANNKMVAVAATITASSPNGHPTSIELVSITSSEGGAGDVTGAAIGTDDRAFELRAKRNGGGAGRTYTVTYRATDTATGLSATASATVFVPHDMGQ
jgi:hypothetical protein